MKQILVTLFLFIIFSVSAQVPGYMGKKCSFTYSAWVHPQFKTISDFFGFNDPYDDISLNATHALEMDYIVQRRGVLCLTYQYSHLGLDYIEDNQNSNNNYTYKGTEKFPAVLNLHGLSIGYKLFPSSRLAPVGTYIKWDILGLYGAIKYNTGAMHNYYKYPSYGGTVKKVSEPVAAITEKDISFGGGAAFSLGRQRVFFDRIIVDSGIRFALVVNRNNPVGVYQSKFSTGSRVFVNQVVNFRLGIGFLAF